MRIDSIPFRPVRLSMVRFKSNGYRILRGNPDAAKLPKDIGTVEYKDGRWRATNTSPPPYTDRHICSSFRAAVLHLARIWTHTSSDGPQDYGSVRMIRVQAGDNWYTVIFDKRGSYVYDDYSIPKMLPDHHQAQLRKVVHVAEKWARENL